MLEILRKMVSLKIVGFTIWVSKRLLTILCIARAHDWHRFSHRVDKILNWTIARARVRINDENRRRAEKAKGAK